MYFNMKKQIIIFSLIGFILIVIIGAGFYYFFIKKAAVSVDNNTPAQQASVEKTTVQALDVKAISDCDKLAGQADKNICRQSYIIKAASSSGDLDKCKQADSAALTADCAAQTSFSLAIKTKDKKYCANIINKTDKENCLKVLAGMGVK